LSNQFYFVAPPGVIKIEEIPSDCGYIEITTTNRTKVIKEAPLRDCKEPTWLFSSSLARRTARHEGVDFTQFSPEALHGIMDVLRNLAARNGSEALLFGYIEKEVFRRASIDYTKKRRERINKRKSLKA